MKKKIKTKYIGWKFKVQDILFLKSSISPYFNKFPDWDIYAPDFNTACQNLLGEQLMFESWNFHEGNLIWASESEKEWLFIWEEL